MNVGENLVWDLQFGIQIPAITVLNIVCIHPLDWRGYTVKQSAVSFSLYNWWDVSQCSWQHCNALNTSKSISGSVVRLTRHMYNNIIYRHCVKQYTDYWVNMITMIVNNNPTTCLIPGPVWPMLPNGIRIRSTIFPQCTGQTDAPTDRQIVHGKVWWLWAATPLTRATQSNNNNNNNNNLCCIELLRKSGPTEWVGSWLPERGRPSL